MLLKLAFSTALFAGLAAAQSDMDVVAVLLWGRHGDRTPKTQAIGIEGSAVLTTLGANECFESAQYFNNRYYNSSSPYFIQGITTDIDSSRSQIYASTSNDNVLGLSAQAFLQGLYQPSIGDTAQTLANGTTETDPLSGYQYVLMNGVPSTAPDIIWIAGDQSCPTQTKASSIYYNSSSYLSVLAATQPFYNSFTPLLQGYFTPSQIGFNNAYNVFDYLNVGYIHNTTIFNNITAEQLFQLRTLADAFSFNLVYNASNPNASIGGMTLAYNVLTHLNQTVSQSSPALKITYFASAYSVMLAFWGLTNLTAASPNFYGLPDYASTMAFELLRPSNATGFNDLSVRFGFRNGSNPSTELEYFPMFGSNSTEMSWNDWSAAMSNISIDTVGQWCSVCNATSFAFCTGSGATALSASSSSGSAGGASAAESSSSSGSGLTLADAGGIGAGVTIGVIAIIEGLIALWYFSTRKPKASVEKTPSVAGSGGEAGTPP